MFQRVSGLFAVGGILAFIWSYSFGKWSLVSSARFNNELALPSVLAPFDDVGRYPAGSALLSRSRNSSTDGRDPTTFKFMQFNILADGLSQDGFLGPPIGRTSQNLKIRRRTKWSDITTDETLEKEQKTKRLLAPVTETENFQHVEEDGKMSELISDTISFKELVVDSVDAALKKAVNQSPQCKDANYTYDKKLIFGLLSTCASHWQAHKSYVYQGHEAAKYQHGNDGMAKFQKPDEVTSDIFEEGKCKSVKEQKNALSMCGNFDQGESHLTKIVLESLNQYINALERFNRKWGLRYLIQSSSDLLSWGNAAWEEEQEGFKPKPGRGKMLVDKIEMEKPDILTMQEVDHYRFFQDALVSLPSLTYSSSLGSVGGSKYEYRRDFFNDLPEATDSTWAKTFSKKTKSGFPLTVEESKQNQQEYQTKFLTGNMKNFAYLPKRGSNAQALHPNPISESAKHNDNDGVAVFWNAERFEVEKIEKVIYPVQIDEKKRVYPGKEGGVCGVLLRDKRVANKLVWVLTTHVPSGNKEENEEERIGMVISASQQIQKWIKSSVSECAAKKPSCQVEMVVGMDGNSNPGYQNGKIEQSKNMASTIQNTWQVPLELKLALYQLESGNEDVGKYPHTSRISASVNKMRGLSSSQPWKIGEYQCDRIDYVFMSEGLKQTKAPELPVYNVDRADVHAGDPAEVAKVYNAILPTSDNPSDHLPFIVELEYKSTRESPVVDQKSSGLRPHQKVIAVILGPMMWVVHLNI